MLVTILDLYVQVYKLHSQKMSDTPHFLKSLMCLGSEEYDCGSNRERPRCVFP